MVEPGFVLLLREQTGSALRVLPVPQGPSSPIGEGIILEPVELQRRRYLLMLMPMSMAPMPMPMPDSAHARHNGQPAWPVTLLRIKDEVRTAAGTFFVSSERGPSVFPPKEHHLGVQCPLCTLKIEAGTQLFACGSCGALLHCEDERWPEAQRLECARLAPACPSCQQAIDFRTGLAWEPEP